jgi:hypothetical protein
MKQKERGVGLECNKIFSLSLTNNFRGGGERYRDKDRERERERERSIPNIRK